MRSVFGPRENPRSITQHVSGQIRAGDVPTYHCENPQLPHHLTGITNENGVRFARFGYYADGRVRFTEHAQTDNGGPQEYREYIYPSSTSTNIRDALGNTESLHFQTNLGIKNIVRITYPQFIETTQSVDAQNNVISRVNEDGWETTYAYNAANQLIAITEGAGTGLARTTTYEYLSSSIDLPTRIVHPSAYGEGSNVVSITYNAQNNPLTITQSGYTPAGTPISRTVSYTYNAFGQITSIDGARTDISDVTNFAYYECVTGGACGRLQRIANAAGHVTTFDAYDAHGRLLQMTDPNGVIITYSYDLRGRVRTISQLAPGGQTRTSQFFYDFAGNLIRSIGPDGAALDYAYDAANYVRSITDGVGNAIT